MAAARAPRPQPRRAPAPRSRVRAVQGGRRAGGRASGIRWDRVSRVGLLVVFAVIVVLYVQPLHSYVATWQEAKAKRAEVQRLTRENERLRARRQALRSPATLEREARRMGMVKPGERPYVVKGLPKGR
jgi:cell division protein FtsB